MAAAQTDPLKGSDHRKALEALRDLLADHLRVADPNVSAQIAGRLQAVLTDIAALPATKQASARDEVKAARERRRSA